MQENISVHGEKAHERWKGKFRKFPVYQPSRSRVQFHTMKYMSQRDSKGATLSKAAQDQREDKPLPVALMLTQG